MMKQPIQQLKKSTGLNAMKCSSRTVAVMVAAVCGIAFQSSCTRNMDRSGDQAVKTDQSTSQREPSATSQPVPDQRDTTAANQADPNMQRAPDHAAVLPETASASKTVRPSTSNVVRVPDSASETNQAAGSTATESAQKNSSYQEPAVNKAGIVGAADRSPASVTNSSDESTQTSTAVEKRRKPKRK